LNFPGIDRVTITPEAQDRLAAMEEAHTEAARAISPRKREHLEEFQKI